MSQQANTPSRLKASSKLKDSPLSPRPSNPRAKWVSSPDANHNQSCNKVRRSVGASKQEPKSSAEQPNPQAPPLPLGSQKGRELDESKAAVGRHGYRPAVAAEQFARPRRQQRPLAVGPTSKKIEDDPPESDGNGNKNLEALQEKLDMSQSLILNLESEMLNLKAELDKARGFNMELQSQNHKLSQDLAAAEAKIQALSRPDLVRTLIFMKLWLFYFFSQEAFAAFFLFNEKTNC